EDIEDFLSNYELLAAAYRHELINQDMAEDAFSYDLEKALKDPRVKQYLRDERAFEAPNAPSVSVALRKLSVPGAGDWISSVIVIPKCFCKEPVACLKPDHRTCQVLSKFQVPRFGLFKCIFHAIFKNPREQFTNLSEIVGYHRPYRDTCLKFDKPTQWMNISVETSPLLFVTVK